MKRAGIPRVASIVGIFPAFPSETAPEWISQKKILKTRVKTILLPKLAALLLGLKILARGKSENTIHIRASDIFSKYIISYSVELISVSLSLSIKLPSSKKLSVVMSDSNMS